MFGWQRGYGVFSLGRKQLKQAVIYVKNQKEHHFNGTTIASLEDVLKVLYATPKASET